MRLLMMSVMILASFGVHAEDFQALEGVQEPGADSLPSLPGLPPKVAGKTPWDPGGGPLRVGGDPHALPQNVTRKTETHLAESPGMQSPENGDVTNWLPEKIEVAIPSSSSQGGVPQSTQTEPVTVSIGTSTSTPVTGVPST